jgi:hypothetical protein
VFLHMRSRSRKGGRHEILTRSRSDIDGLGWGRNIHQQIESALSDGSAWTGGDGRLDLVVKQGWQAAARRSRERPVSTGIEDGRWGRRRAASIHGDVHAADDILLPRVCCSRRRLPNSSPGRCTAAARARAWRRDWSTAAAACQGHRAHGGAK